MNSRVGHPKAVLLSLMLLSSQTGAAAPVQTNAPVQASGSVQIIDAAHPALTIQSGDMPLILSAPHGGRWRIADVPNRTGKNVEPGKPKASGFQTALDANVDLLTLAIAAEIKKQTGKTPYIVISNITRKQMDPNRPEAIGVEDDRAREPYRKYHAALKDFRAEILRKWGTGFLIDIHGQGSTDDAIYRGTGQGSSVTDLVKTFGREAIVGPDGIQGALEAKGIRFIPSGKEEGKAEASGLSGGWITRHYGSLEDDEQSHPTAPNGGSPFNAIQFESGSKFRNRDAIPQVAKDMAEVFAKFVDRYVLSRAKK